MLQRSLRTVKISQLFSRSAKPDYLSLYKTPESIYHFICDCKEDYIGMKVKKDNWYQYLKPRQKHRLK
jgi:hypothetical protein